MWLQKPPLGTQLDHSDSLNNPVLDLLMNEGHGSRVNDLSGHGNHGTLHGFDFPSTGTSGWNPGMDGVGLTFDGIDDYISVPDFPSLRLTKAVTLDATVMLTGAEETYDVIVEKYIGGDGGSGYKLEMQDANTIRFALRDSSSVFHQVAGSTLAYNTLYRIIGTYDGANQWLYENAIPVNHATWAGAIKPNNANLLIGYDGVDNYIKGSIARARILPRAMSAFEVMQTQIDPWGVYLQ